MVYPGLAWLKQIDPRDPDYDPNAPTLDEMLDARADETERQRREEREEETYARNYGD